MLNVPKALLKEIAAKKEGTTNPVKEAEANEEFCEQRRHKWNSSDDQPENPKEAVTPTARVRNPR